MEKASGNELSKMWPTMDISDKVDIVSHLTSIQATIAAVNFSCHGSLFYRTDIENGVSVPGMSGRFCVGPSCESRFWEDERGSMQGYRGPWPSSTAYATDIARREKEWITRFAKPRDPADPLRQSDIQESPEDHINLLDQYLKIVPHLIPSHPGLNRSILWHPDLHFGNIFVERNKVVSIIDWQGCSTLPIFLACRIPKFLRFNGPLLFDLRPATGLTAQEKQENLQIYQLTHLQKFYISKFRNLDEDIFLAFPFHMH